MCGRLIKEIASKVLDKDTASKVWSRVEVVGDIALIRKPPQISPELLIPLANEILNNLPYVKSVWASTSPIQGPHRTRNYVHLAGEYRTTTIYREHGCSFYVDIVNTYISPVLSYEHLRVAKEVRGGEYVINMFAGVGLFSIIIAKHARPSKVISIDINPYAYELMVRNAKINKVDDVVEPVLGDAGTVIKDYRSKADRVLMPLPELAFNYFQHAVNAIKDIGVIHIYEFERGYDKNTAISNVTTKYLRKSSELGINAEVLSSRVVRSVGPRKYQVVIDLKISK
ncbi:MAG: class I SAM-dependent methyltransferase family protein [Sulfolobales archaeon]|nr:class I SAM-dependent methyltransferase family protein [Sulfolobales archaeon]MCX8185711.1 class I SAM-dependent methyltransferase family protein [Sulfolobales archaeon]MDW7969654.1 class I SAM-dependent methyltransferase family protein [Sulfolobales archaeon]